MRICTNVAAACRGAVELRPGVRGSKLIASPHALADAKPVAPRWTGWGFVLLYALGYTGTWLALLTPGLVSLALRLRQLSPVTATQDLALVLSAGAGVAIVSNPIFGHLSDRTRSRFGRRRPWLLAGMLCGTLALVIVAQARNVGVVLAGWCLAQLAFNAVLAAMVAVLPDQVPERERGTVSGIISVCLPIGQALGSVAVRATADPHRHGYRIRNHAAEELAHRRKLRAERERKEKEAEAKKAAAAAPAEAAASPADR